MNRGPLGSIIPSSESGCDRPKIYAPCFEPDKVVERDYGTAPPRKYSWVRLSFPRADADPVQLVADSLLFGLGATPAYANDRFEGGAPEPCLMTIDPMRYLQARITLFLGRSRL